MAKKKPSSTADDNVDFERAIEEVEQIVMQLESGELGLTESLHQYEAGIKRLKQCHGLLDAAEQRVSVLSGIDAEGNPIAAPLDLESEARPRPRRRGSTEDGQVAPGAQTPENQRGA